MSRAHTAVVAGAVAALRQLAWAHHQSAVDDLDARVQVPRLRVVVAGEAKRGKSTLTNRLIGRDVLPSSVVPVTAVATVVRTDEIAQDDVLVRYLDGRHEHRAFNDLPKIVTERGNPHNVQGVAAVEVTLADAAFGDYPVELVDTPGTGSIFAHNTQVAHEIYDSLDAVIVVLTVDPPITAAERELLVELAGQAVACWVVVNKVDRLEPDELRDATGFTEAACADAGLSVEVWPVSARDRDDGFRRFQDAFAGYLADRAETDATRALTRHARQLATRMRDETAVGLRAGELVATDGREQVERFADALREVTARAAGLDDLCTSTGMRLERELTESATQVVPDLVADAGRIVDAGFAAEVGAAVQIEAETRAAAVDAIITRVDAWRTHWAGRLDDELAALVDRVNHDVALQLQDLRESARTMLGIDLGASASHEPLAPARRFWYATDRATAWEMPGAELARRHGPRSRQRAYKRVQGELMELSDRQNGRARADLSERLRETLRTLRGQLRRHHTELLTQLTAALDAAVDRSAQHIVGQRDAVLRERLGALDRIIADLTVD